MWADVWVGIRQKFVVLMFCLGGFVLLRFARPTVVGVGLLWGLFAEFMVLCFCVRLVGCFGFTYYSLLLGWF